MLPPPPERHGLGDWLFAMLKCHRGVARAQAHMLVKGKHNRRTTAFAKACLGAVAVCPYAADPGCKISLRLFAECCDFVVLW